jgi:hypothetical protein
MDCPSTTDQSARQTCDAFLELGPSHVSSSQGLSILNTDFEAAPQLPTSIFFIFRLEQLPRGASTPIHLSIPTTVLRI